LKSIKKLNTAAAMENKYRLLIALLLVAVQSSSAQKTKKLYPGFTAGWQHSAFQYRGSENVVVNNGAWRGAFVLDYEITRRLSLHTQIGAQHINAVSFFTSDDYKITYPEIWVGFNEYLPVGGSALFLNLSVTGAYGLSTGGTNVFKDANYKPFRMGWGTLLGFMFRNGIYFNTGIQSAFTNYYDNKLGSRVFDFSVHAISIGYMAGNKERNKARRRY
jgi:hypothetical protein